MTTFQPPKPRQVVGYLFFGLLMAEIVVVHLIRNTRPTHDDIVLYSILAVVGFILSYPGDIKPYLLAIIGKIPGIKFSAADKPEDPPEEDPK